MIASQTEGKITEHVLSHILRISELCLVGGQCHIQNAIVCSAGAHMDDESETVLIVNVISPGRSTDLEALSSAHGTLVPSRSV